MYETICFALLITLFVAWCGAELYGPARVRITLGLMCMGFLGAAWVFTDHRMAQLDAFHQACFRQMGSLLEARNIEKVERAVAAYNASHPEQLRVFNAMDAIEGKK
jgi:hypothetical protein